MGLVAVVALALAGLGVGLFVVVAGDDGDADSGRESTVAVTTPTSAGSAPGTDAPEPTEPVGTSEPLGGADTTDSVVPPGSVPGSPSVPGVPSGSDDLAPPAELPQPEGAAPDALTGGLSVPGTVTDAAAFYESALPQAGYVVERTDVPGVAPILSVSGSGLSGQLVFVDLGLGSTTVLWTAT